jgi:hypothetical protein
MKISIADLSDIDDVLALQNKYHIGSIKEEDKSSGFVTISFTRQQLSSLIQEESGLFIARNNGVLVAYAMSASWSFWVAWPMFAHMAKGLPELTFLGQPLSTENSYQYGPICVDQSARGSGVLALIFDFAREKMARRYPILVTFINKLNPRSFAAHTQKLGLRVIQEFEYNNNCYYELVYDTSKPLEFVKLVA